MQLITEKLEQLVAESNLEEAINQLLYLLILCKKEMPDAASDADELRKLLLIISGQYHNLRQRINIGTIDFQTARVESNQIHYAFLDIVANFKQYPEFEKFLKSYEQEEAFWGKTLNKNSIDAYENYLNNYQKGRYSNKARQRLQELQQILIEENNLWKKSKAANTIESYRAYFEAYPDGRYIEEARELLLKLKEKIKHENQEQIVWQNALNENSIESFQTYFQMFPQGRYIEKAKKLILKLKQQKKKSTAPKTEKLISRKVEESEEAKAYWANQLPNDWRLFLQHKYGLIGDITEQVIEEIFTQKTLDCSNSVIATLEPVVALKQLRTITCSLTSITDLAPLQYLKLLKGLDCSYTEITSLEPLSEAYQMLQIDCSNTKVRTLEPLSKLYSLQQLNCSNTRIDNLESLVNLNNLKILYCYGTYIESITPLFNLENLEYLYISVNQIDKREMDSFKEMFDKCKIVDY